MIRDSRIWNSVIIGKPVIESIDVDINSQSLRLQVDMISILPDSLHKALDGRRQITIWGKDLMLAGFPDELVTTSHFRQYEINESRKSRAREFFKSRLLSFTVEAVKKDTQRVYFNGKNVCFHDTPITFNPYTSQFTPIPIIAKDVPVERVQRILYEKLPSIDFLSYQYPEDPPLIIGYHDYFFGSKSGWLGELRQHWRIYCPEGEEVTCVPAEIPESKILRRGNLAFLLDEDLNEINNHLIYGEPFPAEEFIKRFGASTQRTIISENRPHLVSLSSVNPELVITSTAVPRGGGDKMTQPSEEQKTEMSDYEAQEAVDSGEQTFINDLNQVALSNHLVYDMEDLVNFHIAIKTGALVVLAGMSGVGKSQLVINYARALGLSGVDEAGEERKQFLFIPVRPHWNDDADLIGFYDAIHKVYRPSETGLVDLLIEASKEDNDDKLYLICFDEMNLARVEHYFSQFLSILELSEDRYLTLYSEKLAPEVYNRHEYSPRVPIGNNVFFVGTVNIDESSFQFSDKVLDRSNVIRLKIYESLHVWKAMFEEKASGKLLGKPSEERAQLSPVPGKVFSSWCNNSPTEIGLTDVEIDFLDELNSALRKIDKDRVVGYRIIRQIGSYLKNIPCNVEGQSLLDRGKAFDLQLVQRIMTKFKGPECDLEQLFGKYTERDQATSQILQLFDKHQAVSTFSYSREICHKKAKELLDHGYAS
ncbi:AAA family ATPase [Desulfosporosinus sp. BG]|uniref:McrB family protein n=1 Tax=Desulfosporosinus sp. BG TaxID=1633135 RepID=UPI000839DCBD|nr:AAA family ATPase [Desulfosporosinus sp. BG]ODA40628.1 5-methylcytosine-specific restriction related enzyme [Desulfosporosinus sp. BG]